MNINSDLEIKSWVTRDSIFWLATGEMQPIVQHILEYCRNFLCFCFLKNISESFFFYSSFTAMVSFCTVHVADPAMSLEIDQNKG